MSQLPQGVEPALRPLPIRGGGLLKVRAAVVRREIERVRRSLRAAQLVQALGARRKEVPRTHRSIDSFIKRALSVSVTARLTMLGEHYDDTTKSP